MSRISQSELANSSIIDTDIDTSVSLSPNRISADDLFSSRVVESKPGIFREAGDIGIEFANAALGSAEAMSDFFFRPGNYASEELLSPFREYLETFQTDTERFEKLKYGYELGKAKNFGEEALITAKYAAKNPLMIGAMGLGSFLVPAGAIGLVGKATKLAGLTGKSKQTADRFIGGGGTGFAMAAGDSAGQAYDIVVNLPQETLERSGNYRDLINIKRLTPEQAREELAQDAASAAQYIPGVLGFFSGATGLERILTAPKEVKKGLAVNALKNAGIEFVTEALEEGTALASAQYQASKIDPSIDFMKGVGGAATLGGFAGAVPGAVGGLMEGSRYNKLLDESPADGTTPPEQRLADAKNVSESVDAATDMAGDLSDTIGNLQTSVDEYLQSTPNLPSQTTTTPPPTTPLQDTQVDEEPKTSAVRPTRIPFEMGRKGSAAITPYDVKTARDIFREELTTFNDEFEPRINLDDTIIKTAIANARDSFFTEDTGEAGANEFDTALVRATTNLNKKLDKAGANSDLRDATNELVGRISDDYANRLRDYNAPNVADTVAGRNPLLTERRTSVQRREAPETAQAPQATNIEQSLKQKYPNVNLRISETDKGITLNEIVVPEADRNQGVGTNVINDLVSYADQTNQTIALTPDTTFGGNKTKLNKLYKSFGFVPNKGRNKDFQFRETLIRQPKVEQPKFSTPRGKVAVVKDKFNERTAPIPGQKLTFESDGRSIDIVDQSRLENSGKVLKQIGRIFGKRIIAFESDNVNEEGFVLPDTDPDSIYLNTSTEINPLAVFGHELLHLIKVDNRKAYDALETVVKRNISAESQQEFAQRTDYSPELVLEEMSADLLGNRFLEDSFWNEVFTEIGIKEPKAQKTIISRLSATVRKAINQLLSVLTVEQFDTDEYVVNMTDVKKAVKSAVKTYAKERRVRAAEFDRAEIEAEKNINLKQKEETVKVNPKFADPAVTEEIEYEEYIPDKEQKQKQNDFRIQYNAVPYLSGGQQTYKIDISDAKFNVKRKAIHGSHPKLRIPQNADGSVSLYYHGTASEIRKMNNERKLKAHDKKANRVYLTNESTPSNVMDNRGNMPQPMDGAAIKIDISAENVHIDKEYPDGRKDFFVPTMEGEAFAQKMNQFKIHYINTPRKKGFDTDNTINSVAEAFDKQVKRMLQMTPKERQKEVREAKAILKDQHNIGDLLTENAKLEKTRINKYGLDFDGKGVVTMGLGLASAQKLNTKGKLNACPDSAFCMESCLANTSGNNKAQGGEGDDRSGPRLAQYLKTEAMMMHPKEFGTILFHEMDLFVKYIASKKDTETLKEPGKKAIAIPKKAFYPSFRPNVTSDFPGKVWKPFMDAFGMKAMFYDYTKVIGQNPIAPNHHLTYSANGAVQVIDGKLVISKELKEKGGRKTAHNWNQVVERLLQGEKEGRRQANVAMSFTSRKHIPKTVIDEKTGEEFEVIDGDGYDARFLDPKSPTGRGFIVGLISKDKKGTEIDLGQENPFFFYYDPKVHGDTLTVADQSKIIDNPDNLEIHKSKAELERESGTPPTEQPKPTSVFRGIPIVRRASKARIPKDNFGDWKRTLDREVERNKYQLESPEFRNWFGDSTVIENGKPQIVYHGTNSDFTEFLLGKTRTDGSSFSAIGSGFYFASDKLVAGGYANTQQENEQGGFILPVYLSIENPLIVDSSSLRTDFKNLELTEEQVREIITSAPNYVERLNDYEDVGYVGEEAALNKVIDLYVGSSNFMDLEVQFYDGREKEFLEVFSEATGFDGVRQDFEGNSIYVAFFPNQVKSAISNNGDFSIYENDIRFSKGRDKGSGKPQPAVTRRMDESGFYSKALETAEGLQQEKGTGQQFESMMKKAGVSKEEMEWLGLPEVFKQPKLTKTDLVKHINDNRIKLREVVDIGEVDPEATEEWSEPENMTAEDALGPDYISNRADELVEDAEREDRGLDIDEAEEIANEEYYDNPFIKTVSNYGYVIIGKDDIGYQIFEKEFESDDFDNAFATLEGRKRYDLKNKIGLKIYSLNEAQIQARAIAENRGDFSSNLGMNETQFSQYTESGGENYQELRFQLDDDEVLFREGTHFASDENNLFHIRAKDRDYNGTKVLYVEELQSDWAQQGRDRGFKKTEEEMAAISKRRKETQAALEKYEQQVEKTGKDLEGSDLDKANEARNYLRDTQSFVFDNDKKLFKAPFVTSTDKWTQLAIKKLMTKAVKENYDYVAFSNGVVQANRWNEKGLRTFYDEIIPKNINKVVGKIDREAITAIDARDTGLVFEMSPGQSIKDKREKIPTRVAIEITPKIKDFVAKGVPMFSRGRATRGDMTRRPVSGQMRYAWSDPKQEGFDAKLDEFRYNFQDKYIDLERIIDAAKQAGTVIKDRWNPFILEQTYHGRTAKKSLDFAKKELQPILQSMKQNNLTMADVQEYAHNKHAEERNVQIEKINPEMQDGGSGINTADARRYLANLDPEKKRKLERVHGQMMGMQSRTRQLLVDSGLEKQETIDIWENTYQNYVPLQRADLDFVDPEGVGTGSGFQVKGSASKRAKGSKKDVVDIFANIVLQRERAIVRSEKTRVARSLLNLAIKAPNPDFWLAVDPNARNKGQVKTTLRKLGMNDEDIDGVFYNPKELKKDYETGFLRQEKRKLTNDNYAFAVRIDGKEKFLVFNANNERAKRIAEVFKNMDGEQMGQFMQVMGHVSRYFSNINTQYNPIFGAVNLTRDTQAMALQLSTTPLRDKKAEVLKKVPGAIKAVYRKERARTANKEVNINSLNPEQQKFTKFYEEFENSGAKTGYRDQFNNSDDRRKALQKELDRMKKGVGKKSFRATLDWLTNYNDALENATRLGVYITAREMGIEQDSAAAIAKNITTNFNKKGKAVSQLNAMYAFYGAATQGITRMAQTMGERTPAGKYRLSPTGKKIMIGGLTLGALQNFLLFSADYEEDEIPTFIKERNFIIPLFDDEKNYLMVPMPLGYNVIPNMSRHLAEMFTYETADKPDHLFEIFRSVFDSFNPIGGGDIYQAVTPTPLDPLMAIGMNRDFSGRTIAREDFSGLRPTPGYTRAKEGASIVGKGLAQFINFASFGNEDVPGIFSPSPDTIDYIFGQAFGGVGRETLKLTSSIESLITGEELPSYKIPLAGRFYGNAGGKAGITALYYANLKRVYLANERLDGLIERGEDTTEHLKRKPEATLESYAFRQHRKIGKLRKQRRKLIEDDAPKESIKNIESSIETIMKNVNMAVRNKREKK